MAISRQRKEEVLAQYKEWMDRSQAIILVEYIGVKVKDLDVIRAKVRETGGEVHILKNTLARKVFESYGMKVPAGLLEKSTAVTFAFTDPASTAKALIDVTKGMEAIKLKGGFLDKQALTAVQVKSLADMPPLPVVRAQLLGVLQAPASKLVRTIAEPARSLASVFRAYTEKAQVAA
ncbi:MAG: 50S ribosomal protein L10 [Chloroflexi bacterium]|nr:MAG: 50S ribosomal protein L10 [Chloroflexota bacterium]